MSQRRCSPWHPGFHPHRQRHGLHHPTGWRQRRTQRLRSRTTPPRGHPNQLHPSHPTTCGKVERFHQTLKKWLKAQPRAATLAELQAQLDAFIAEYNHRRPHSALPQHATPPPPTPPAPKPALQTAPTPTTGSA
ncbi:MAG: transposase, partial [Actinobacteria bacterium]|nr:transposase [Actinomycetota bacterium]